MAGLTLAWIQGRMGENGRRGTGATISAHRREERGRWRRAAPGLRLIAAEVEEAD
jgi:hypothetical protein